MGKHTPIRECICCRRKNDKRRFIRIAKKKDGFSVDLAQKEQGRGAYICFECLNASVLLKKRPLDRAFRQKVPEKVYAELTEVNEREDFIE